MKCVLYTKNSLDAPKYVKTLSYVSPPSLLLREALTLRLLICLALSYVAVLDYFDRHRTLTSSLEAAIQEAMMELDKKTEQVYKTNELIWKDELNIQCISLDFCIPLNALRQYRKCVDI